MTTFDPNDPQMRRTGESPLRFDQVLIGETISAIIIHDTEHNNWHVIPVPTEKLSPVPLSVAVNSLITGPPFKVIASG